MKKIQMTEGTKEPTGEVIRASVEPRNSKAVGEGPDLLHNNAVPPGGGREREWSVLRTQGAASCLGTSFFSGPSMQEASIQRRMIHRKGIRLELRSHLASTEFQWVAFLIKPNWGINLNTWPGSQT